MEATPGSDHQSSRATRIAMKVAVLTLFLASAVYGSPDWDNLKVTWSANIFTPGAFSTQPRAITGTSRVFVLRDDQCKANATGKFLGQRYWHKFGTAVEPALVLLYDTKGIIAGIQTSISKREYTPPATNVQYVDDGDYWTLTAYFVDPSTICGDGRSLEQLQNEGTGTGLWIQTGPDPIKNSVSIPLNEVDVQKTAWKFGHCFRSMGSHYWFNVTKGMSCDDFVPNCLLYNKGKLSGFCFATNADLYSQRYEHPTTADLQKFIDPVPECFYTNPAYKYPTTMHVFFTSNPRSARC